MKYTAIATDYDGTLATDGLVDDATLAALEHYRAKGGTLILATGRELDDLLDVFPAIELFHRVVVENGGVLYRPESKTTALLAQPLPSAFVDTLRERGVGPLSVGQTLVATWEPHSTVVKQTLADMNLAAHVILNKRAVMVLPHGVSKASGLKTAFTELNLLSETVAAIGDAQNDHALFEVSGLGVAVANALTDLKTKAHRVTNGARGAGVQELIQWVLAEESSV